MSLNRKIQFGMAGAGTIAQVYAQAFASSDMAELVAVADTEMSKARALAQSVHATAYDSYTELLRSKPRVDAILVCTPPAAHLENCREALRQGFPVLCEKPLSTDARSARLMLEEAERTGVPFTVASKFRFVGDIAEAKRLIAAGTIGEPILLQNSFTSPVDMRGRWNSQKSISGGGVLIDHGPHSVDLIRHLCGPVAEIFAVEGSRSQGLAVEETVHFVARTSGGVLAIVDLSWNVDKQSDSYISVRGTLGSISIGFRESSYRLHTSSDHVFFGRGYDKIGAFRDQIRNFAAVLRGEDTLLVKPSDGLASSEVIEAGYDALATGKWTLVNADEPRQTESRWALRA